MQSSNPVLIEKENIWQVIPQRSPMIMVDQLVSCGEISTTTKLLVSRENIFCVNGLFTEAGMVENIAQTAAARVGYICKEANVAVPIGYIGAVKSLKFYFLPEVNTQITTEIVISHQVFDVTVINGTVTVAGKIAAECEMKIFIKKDSQG